MRRLDIGKYRHKGFLIVNAGKHFYGRYKVTRGEKFFFRATDLKDAAKKIDELIDERTKDKN